MSDFNIEFVIDFMEDDLLKSALSYQLLIGNIGNKKSPRDLKVRDTILIIIEDFFMNNQSALLYICETGDGKQMARGRLFAYSLPDHQIPERKTPLIPSEKSAHRACWVCRFKLFPYC